MSGTAERKHAKLCYEHIGGKLGELLLQSFIARGWLVREPGKKEYYLTKTGAEGFTHLGIDLSQLKS